MGENCSEVVQVVPRWYIPVTPNVISVGSAACSIDTDGGVPSIFGVQIDWIAMSQSALRT